jgi:hypothetical protein
MDPKENTSSIPLLLDYVITGTDHKKKTLVASIVALLSN